MLQPLNFLISTFPVNGYSQEKFLNSLFNFKPESFLVFSKNYWRTVLTSILPQFLIHLIYTIQKNTSLCRIHNKSSSPGICHLLFTLDISYKYVSFKPTHFELFCFNLNHLFPHIQIMICQIHNFFPIIIIILWKLLLSKKKYLNAYLKM